MASDCRQMVVHSYNHSVFSLAYILDATFYTRNAVVKIYTVATDLGFSEIGAASGVAFDSTRGIETRTMFASVGPKALEHWSSRDLSRLWKFSFDQCV